MTEMESPSPVPSSTVAAWTVSRMASPWSTTSAMVPSSSTIPVNIQGLLWGVVWGSW